ncbi:MAG: YegP family protein [Verrucomicrobiota bacterium]
MKYEYWKSKANSNWYWHLKAANGKIIATGGEGYNNKADALAAIKLVKGSSDAPENNLTPNES